jgi:enoyl-CoA hydratase/carnithine racemase
MSDLVTVTDEGPVRIIRMNRPEKKNALTMAMYDAMAQGIETAKTSAAC